MTGTKEVVTPEPAATLVLLREGEGGLETLLTQRVYTAAFVPGAWVFPGGDGSTAMTRRSSL